MGLFDKIFKKDEKYVQNYFKTLTAYQPVFSSYEGGLYEMALTRAAIHSIATHISKLKPEVNGPNNERLKRILQYKPNRWQDTSKFLYRLATIYLVQNNAFIAPIYADDLETIVGYYPLLPDRCEVMEYGGTEWLRYQFGSGQKGIIEFNKAGLLTQFQYKDDIFGANNAALYPTLQLLNTQQQGIIEGIKTSATLRFMARLAQPYKPELIKAERQAFVENNLSYENNGGVLMFDTKYADVKPIDSKPFVIDEKQMRLINESVYSYFGVSDKILTNTFTEDEWNAFYEGKIEPFAIQASLVLTNMTFTDHELSFGNDIILSANRLQYASNQTKLNVVTQLFDRGMITQNQGLEIFNMPKVDNGDTRFIRGEYVNTAAKVEVKDDNEGQTV